MNQEYFEKISDMAKKAQEPLKAIAELNIKTMQVFSYMKPEELTKIKKPEEFLEKQLELAISNGHKALEYMQKTFQILEQATLSFAKDVKEKTEIK